MLGCLLANAQAETGSGNSLHALPEPDLFVPAELAVAEWRVLVAPCEGSRRLPVAERMA